MKVIASELCHERGARHTCDRRQKLSDLHAAYGDIVDYTEIPTEEDPLWHPVERETLQLLTERAGRFVEYLFQRDDLGDVVSVAAHSAFLLSLMTVLYDDKSLKAEGPAFVQKGLWFGTGEMRCMELVFEKNAGEALNASGYRL